jgi:hypothetical protein
MRGRGEVEIYFWGWGEMFGKFIFEHSPRVSDAAKLLIRIYTWKHVATHLIPLASRKAEAQG